MYNEQSKIHAQVIKVAARHNISQLIVEKDQVYMFNTGAILVVDTTAFSYFIESTDNLWMEDCSIEIETGAPQEMREFNLVELKEILERQSKETHGGIIPDSAYALFPAETYELSKSQFVVFMEYLWDSHIPGLHSDFWDYVENLEKTRDGDNHEPNAIYSYTLKNGETNLHWGYTTYRGTRVEATYQNGTETFTVTIPGLRNFDGTHIGYIELVRKDLPYRSWWEMMYHFDDDSIKVYAARSNVSLKEAVIRKADAMINRLCPEEFKAEGFEEDYEEFEDDYSPDEESEQEQELIKKNEARYAEYGVYGEPE